MKKYFLITMLTCSLILSAQNDVQITGSCSQVLIPPYIENLEVNDVINYGISTNFAQEVFAKAIAELVEDSRGVVVSLESDPLQFPAGPFNIDINNVQMFNWPMVEIQQAQNSLMSGQGAVFPEGNYSFCFRLVDANTNQTLTVNDECVTFQMTNYEIPILIRPIEGEAAILNVDQLIFSHNPPAADVMPNYEVNIFRKFENQDCNQTIEVNPPFFTSITQITSLLLTENMVDPDHNEFCWSVNYLDPFGNSVPSIPDAFTVSNEFEANDEINIGDEYEDDWPDLTDEELDAQNWEFEAELEDGRKVTVSSVTRVSVLDIMKAVNKAQAKVGDTLTYTIRIKVNEDRDHGLTFGHPNGLTTSEGRIADHIEITDPIPKGTKLIGKPSIKNGSMQHQDGTTVSKDELKWWITPTKDEEVVITFKVVVMRKGVIKNEGLKLKAREFVADLDDETDWKFENVEMDLALTTSTVVEEDGEVSNASSKPKINCPKEDCEENWIDKGVMIQPLPEDKSTRVLNMVQSSLGASTYVTFREDWMYWETNRNTTVYVGELKDCPRFRATTLSAELVDGVFIIKILICDRKTGEYEIVTHKEDMSDRDEEDVIGEWPNYIALFKNWSLVGRSAIPKVEDAMRRMAGK